MANFEQAMKWLREGKGVKRTNWRIDGDVHLILKDGSVFDCYGKEYRFDYDDIIVKNWILYNKKGLKGGKK